MVHNNLKRILIGSPVNQNPKVLEEFLDSLSRLKKKSIQTDIMFINDNESYESIQLLREYEKQHSSVKVFDAVYENERRELYSRDENSHIWRESLIWKVAQFKNIIIQRSIEESYDYLFLVDSDLVLHPNTLENLISTGKDIISNIFWTKWQLDHPELPQVWLSDQYTLYQKKRGETLTQEVIDTRYEAFLKQLKVPGIYEVGGLGACTLISKNALLTGVNYNEIRNISLTGEDRHFCVRASALGFPLYVDTHYPAYHIYRLSDLDGVAKYKKNSIYSTTNAEKTAFERSAKPDKNKLTLSMILRNESERYLRKVLQEHIEYIDEAVIIDDGSTDDSLEICREILQDIPLHLIKNPVSMFSNEILLRKQQWEETIKTNPDWILNLDADEMFESHFAIKVKELINQTEIDVYCFRLYDLWNETHYREDEFWRAHFIYRPFLIRYQNNFPYTWNETSLHCGRFPDNITEKPILTSSLRLKHLGWATEKDRKIKYKRYMSLDPKGEYGWLEQYKSILAENPRLIPWKE